ncbi:MAG: prepilin peptidase [Bdellovibrionales bacterium CG10_big_fil_rev_8_21_14_0_10_45_34]|nr:MAG: prepilin peptidase [Bdellovibrionales bacterium CG10_big_fil_rev_8_21_14_0_10_45_34]
MDDLIVLAVGAGVLGLLLGSFANVFIYRWPKGESVITPRSRCPNCKMQVAWYDNIPVISWIILRGKCRGCTQRISIRYPLVELLTGILFFFVVQRYGVSWFTLEALVLVFGLVVISFVDLDTFLIPDIFSLGGLALGLAGAALNPEREFMDAFGGALVGGGFLWLTAYTYWLVRKEEGMGGGDIKLLAWLGAVLGWTAVPFIILVSSVLGSLVGLSIVVANKGNMKTVIPFGPYIAIAGVLFLLGGDKLSEWYLAAFFPWLTG